MDRIYYINTLNNIDTHYQDNERAIQDLILKSSPYILSYLYTRFTVPFEEPPFLPPITNDKSLKQRIHAELTQIYQNDLDVVQGEKSSDARRTILDSPYTVLILEYWTWQMEEEDRQAFSQRHAKFLRDNPARAVDYIKAVTQEFHLKNLHFDGNGELISSIVSALREILPEIQKKVAFEQQKIISDFLENRFNLYLR